MNHGSKFQESASSTSTEFAEALPLTCVFSLEALLAAMRTCMRKKRENHRQIINSTPLCRLNDKFIHLLDGEQLAGVQIHAHIHPSKSTATNQLPLSPPDRRRIFNWRQSPHRRLREEPDSRFPYAGANFLDQPAECAILPAAGPQIPEIQRLTNRSEESLHRLEAEVSER